MKRETKTIYSSFDGMEFNSSAECFNHEFAVLGLIPIEFPLNGWRGDYSTFCATIRSYQQYDSLLQYFIENGCVGGENSWYGDEPERYPWKGIIVLDGFGGGGCGGMYGLSEVEEIMYKATNTLAEAFKKGE